MGALLKLVDVLLFLAFLLLAVVVPLIDFQEVFPKSFYPDFVIDLKRWYVAQSGDYLMAEAPHFVVGLIWFELLFQWPLLFLNLYAFLSSKAWYKTTCLIYGVSLVSSMSATMGEVVGSNRASNTLLTIYWPFMGLGVLATLRGLVPCSSKAPINGPRPSNGRKKRA
ncbi:Transmembrane protein 97 [Cucurbita argyrosperma subsp. argyrosperma]|uniref:Sigma intracellular receptor 2-like n=1 Tax=Cucurbita moschata TaxID=3662 RepID=A0A6J1EVW1_CUCMO|nr:sigma intracellular receptor 2-like [Cucurbita moschata]KAG7022872.1 Transmembrane protein 97 [Cucurbita argyrosperma subsp. argyrosperma]